MTGSLKFVEKFSLPVYFIRKYKILFFVMRWTKKGYFFKRRQEWVTKCQPILKGVNIDAHRGRKVRSGKLSHKNTKKGDPQIFWQPQVPHLNEFGQNPKDPPPWISNCCAIMGVKTSENKLSVLGLLKSFGIGRLFDCHYSTVKILITCLLK